MYTVSASIKLISQACKLIRYVSHKTNETGNYNLENCQINNAANKTVGDQRLRADLSSHVALTSHWDENWLVTSRPRKLN